MTSLIPESWKFERLDKCVLYKPEYGANSPGIEYLDIKLLEEGVRIE